MDVRNIKKKSKKTPSIPITSDKNNKNSSKDNILVLTKYLPRYIKIFLIVLFIVIILGIIKFCEIIIYLI